MTLVILAELIAALILGLGSAAADPHGPPFRTAQLIGPCLPEPPPCPPAPCPPVSGMPAPAAPGTAGPPTPTVSIHVLAPATAAAGQDLEYRIRVENTSGAAAHHVLVRNPLPANAKFVRAAPKPDESGAELVWRLGTLDGRAAREIVLVLAPTGGDVDDCARVQFEHGECVTTRITRPQLTVRKTGPTEAVVGETMTFRITVTNTGEAPAADVNLVERLLPGLQFEQEPFDRNTEKRWPLGTLAPRESKSVEYHATARTAGRHCTSAEATAAGGIVSEPAKHCVNVGSRDVTLEIEGPRTAYAKRPVNFFLTVRNNGTLPAPEVVVTNALPEGLEFLEANQGGRHRDGTVTWNLGTLPGGQSRILQLRVQSENEREVRQVPAATYGRDGKATSEIATKFLGAAGFDFDVSASEYAVEVDTQVRYRVTVFNRGTGAQTNVGIVVELPPQMEFKEAKGPAGVKYREDKGVVTFDALPTLAANSDVDYEVVTVARKVGEARVQVGMRAGAGERPTYKSVLTQVGEKQPR
ncbi:MAG TPA: DUF11 domain-containing protein [Gemmataceae bacterium]|nr:DUF11 domain-containing protein [Gemmataceae bacterium]